MTERFENTDDLMWTSKMMRDFNERNNVPLGKDYAEGNENVIVSEKVFVAQDGRSTGTGRSSQMMVIGGHDTGKTHYVIRPNLMRAFGSYVVVDSDGSLLEESRKKLEQSGYEIKVLNFATSADSDYYNPLKYAYTDQDVVDIVNCILDNTNRENVKTSDPFWNKTEASIFTAILLYILHFLSENNHTMAKAREIVELAVNSTESFNQLFEAARKLNSSDSALVYYDSAKLATSKTLRAACISVAMSLLAFDGDARNDLSVSDSIGLEKICDTKTAIFLTGFLVNRTQSVLIPMLFNQVFTAVIHHMTYTLEDCNSANLLTLMLDDLQNLGRIPRLAIHLATCRKYGISAIMTTQTIGQIRNIYEEDAESIFDSCRITVYMSGASCFGVTSLLGDKTINTQESGVVNKASELFINAEDVRRMPDGYCLVYIPGMPTYMDRKCGFSR